MKNILAKRADQSVGFMLDTKGPSLLTGSLKEQKPIELRAGQAF